MEKKLKEGDYKMLMVSMDYIYNNPNILTSDIPNHLLKFWSIPDFTENPKYETNSVQVLIFLYIIRLYGHDNAPLDSILNTIRFSQLFYSFQLILATTLYCRNARLKAEPFPIFHLHEYRLPDLNDSEEMIKIYEIITDKTVIRKQR
ncbi:hypothetical protein [uncultured Odoribacter sp.]|uniref:hypothetical protein n=1 Tax=uncultured Odoribacter sp. TaxID=876416 RepID=UPI00261390AC|nr:hypothetical protein [uncultured Odoribacter sp.]